MCGRYEVHTPVEDLAREFDAVLRADPAQLPPRYNIAPSLKVPVVRVRKGERELASLSWGLLPSWSKKAQGNRPINARAESLFEKPMFRNAIARRRCLIPADGFYEWQQHPAGKQPWHIGMIDDKTFALGGIWEYWAIEGQEPVLSCSDHRHRRQRDDAQTARASCRSSSRARTGTAGSIPTSPTRRRIEAAPECRSPPKRCARIPSAAA
jgi:putative SOS response-associated peptidase YedK